MNEYAVPNAPRPRMKYGVFENTVLEIISTVSNPTFHSSHSATKSIFYYFAMVFSLSAVSPFVPQVTSSILQNENISRMWL